MYKSILTIFLGLTAFTGFAQINTYKDSIETFQIEYMMNHEVVKGSDHKYISFYPAQEMYRVIARFQPIINDSTGMMMKTSGTKIKKFYRYGYAHFSLKNKVYQLTIYKPDPLVSLPENLEYLFLPFTDETSGKGSYLMGRYIDLKVSDIHNHSVTIDFNKAYNPYCAYTTGYNCPIPPAENHLNIEIRAGEKAYSKQTNH